MIRRMFRALSRVTHRVREEVGQTTAEYALVLLGAAAIAMVLLTWATTSGAIEYLLNGVWTHVVGLVH